MAKEIISQRDYSDYIDYMKSLLELTQDLNISDEPISQSVNLDDFAKSLDNKDFTAVSKNNTKTIDFQMNPKATFKTTDTLEQLGETSIKRRNQSISISNHEHDYHAGSSSQINFGNKTSFTNLNKDYKQTSISTGKSTSILKGNTTNKSLVKEAEKVYTAQESSSINIFSSKIENWSYTGFSGAASASGNNFYKKEASFECLVDSTGLSAWLTTMPLKGHFTGAHHFNVAAYADLCYTENTWGAFTIVYSVWDKARTTKLRDETALLEDNVFVQMKESLNMEQINNDILEEQAVFTRENFRVLYKQHFFNFDNNRMSMV